MPDQAEDKVAVKLNREFPRPYSSEEEPFVLNNSRFTERGCVRSISRRTQQKVLREHAATGRDDTGTPIQNDIPGETLLALSR